MNKLLLLVVILSILLGLYWYQSKMDDKYENENEIISLTDNENNNHEEPEIEHTDNEETKSLHSFNMEMIEEDNKSDKEDSHFTDSDLRGDPQGETNPDISYTDME